MEMKLHDIALFSVSRNLWRRNHGNVSVMDVNWREKTNQVKLSVSEFYPDVPVSIQKQIIKCVKLMGEEIIDLINYRQFNSLFCLHHLHANEIVWTSNFTIDRLKTLLAISIFKTKVEGYACPVWAKRFWQSQGGEPQVKAFQYFGNYRFWVFLHWVCYMKTTLMRNMMEESGILFLREPRRSVAFIENREGRHTFFGDHLNYFRKYYENNSPSENVFRFLVISGIVESMPRFLFKLCPAERRENVYLMTKLLITDYSNKYFRPTSHVLVSTLLYLWGNLNETDRTKIVQDHFEEFFNFILSFPCTEVLIASLDWYNPLVENVRHYRRYLEKTIAAISRNRDCNHCLKQRLIFHILYKKFGCYLSEIDIINLIEKLLIIRDTEMAVMIVQVLDNTQKDLLLNAIHKIWNDLWKDSIEKETFLNFFFEVQSGLISSSLVKI